MPWRPLPRIAVAVATYPFAATYPTDLPLEIGDDLYIIERGGKDGEWYRGYLVAPPSLLSGLTSGKGQTLEARVFSGVFPKCCVEVREHLGDAGSAGQTQEQSINGESPSPGQRIGGSPKRQGSLMRRKISARTDSQTSDSRKEPVPSGDIDPETNLPRVETRSPSHQRTDINNQTLARKLSHRSIVSPKFRNSPEPSTPVRDTPPDPRVKRPQAPVPMLKIGDETPTSTSEPLVDEISSCLREWHSKNLHELLLARRYSTLDKISDLVHRLEMARRQLLHGVLTAKELHSLREETVWDLVTGNKLLSNGVIVRDPNQNGRLLTGDDSPFELSKLQSTMSLLDRPPALSSDLINSYHLMVELKSFAANGLLSPTINLYLCAKHQGEACRTLSENFSVELPSADIFQKMASIGTLRTLFADLTANDIGDASRPGIDLYLVVKVQASQAVKGIASSPCKTSRIDEDGKPRPTTGNAGVQSVKGGRQSFMWAQKQFGSVRSRSQPIARVLPEAAIAEAPPTPEERSRPTTQDSSRPTTQPGTQYVKRNVGVGVINLKQTFNQNVVGDHNVAIWAPSAMPAHLKNTDWNDLLRELMYSKNGTYAKAKSVDHVSLGLQLFVHAHVDDLIAKTPTLFQNIPISSRLDFPGAPTKPRSDIYVTLSEVNLPSQALLSHPERGTVPFSPFTELKNVQLTLEIRKRNGARIEDCIIPSTDSQPLKAWRTAAVERGEPWNQMIKLSIPEADVPEAHLVMSIADAPDFPFALGWMPLWTDNAFLNDGTHAPLLYLYDKSTSGSESGNGAYLDIPWNSRGPYGDEKDETVTGPVATLKLETKLCSTVFSQDKTLLGVLNWRHQSKAQTLGFIKRYSFVPEIEIVKLIGDVLDALFGILVNNSGEEEHEDSVFAALGTTLGIVYDRRFNLEPFVDEYALSRFDHPYATPCLIRAYTRLLSDRSNQEKSRRVRATFKVGRHILKFILCAREKQQAKEDGIGATTQSAFKRDLKGLFHSFEDLIKDPAPALIGNKTLVVQYMPTWLPELKTIFSEEEIMHLARDFVNACNDVQGKLISYKLVLILKLTDPALFTQNHVRSRVMADTSGWIKSYWGAAEDVSQQWREQTRLCCSIVCNQIGQPGFESFQYVEKVIESFACLSAINARNQNSLSLLFPTAYPFPSKPLPAEFKFDEALVELGALLTRLAELPLVKASDLTNVETANMISGLLDVITSIISGKAFPRYWLSLYVYHHKSMLQLLEQVCEVMVAKFIPSPEEAEDFDTDLWSKYLNTVLSLVRSDILALETFPEQKRRAVWKIAGDVREQGASLLKKSWEAIGWDTSAEEQKRYGLTRLGGFQVQYVPGLVSPVVELCLSVHEGLRGVAVKILQSMIISEWTLNEDLSLAQAEMIDSLDNLYKTKDVGNNLVQKMFINELLDSFESLARMPLDPLWQAIRDVVSTMDELLELLAAVHGRDADESMRVMDTLQLMNFYKDLQKEDIFIRYVHQLAGIQNRLHNRTEAGLALQLHAELYTWEQTKVRSLDEPVFPEQSSFERKERLYFDMIKHFEEGAAWDCALANYRELASQYELIHYDFAKLARTQRAMATIYETIARGEWQPPRYFRVIYHGLGFQENLRDRQFIYEGLPLERQSAFTDRMRQLHPSAQILSKGEPEDMEGQYLQVLPVSIYRDLELPIYQQPKVAQPTRDYVTAARPYRFAVTSKRHSPASGVQNQWIEKTIYQTREALPTILRRSEIASINTIRLSPLQTAVERTSRKTAELATLEKRVIHGDESGFSNLTEAIISSVDPASAATVAQYRQLVPIQPEEDEEEAEEIVLSPIQNALQIALLDHVSTLKHCLTHYSDSSHIGTQTSLTESMNHTFAPELAHLYPNAPPIQEADFSDILSSPPQSSAGVSSIAAATSLPMTNGNTPQAPDTTSQKSPPGPKARIGFNMLKTSLQQNNPNNSTQSQTPSNPNMTNSSINSAPSESTSTSRSHSQRAAPITPLRQMSGNASLVNGSKASGSEMGERPSTSQSMRSASTSGKVRKRLSLLGIGRMGSKLDKERVGGMGVVGEE